MLLLSLHGGEEEKAFQQLFFQKSFSGYVLFYSRVVSVDSRLFACEGQRLHRRDSSELFSVLWDIKKKY